MVSKYCNWVSIDVDSNGEEVNVIEVEIDSRHAKKTTTLKTGSYKPLASGKPPKCQRKLTLITWEHYEFLEPDGDSDLFYKCKKCGQMYYGDNKYGTVNLKRYLGICKRINTIDIGQLLL